MNRGESMEDERSNNKKDHVLGSNGNMEVLGEWNNSMHEKVEK
jgi:hypothetical protein